MLYLREIVAEGITATVCSRNTSLSQNADGISSDIKENTKGILNGRRWSDVFSNYILKIPLAEDLNIDKSMNFTGFKKRLIWTYVSRHQFSVRPLIPLTIHESQGGYSIIGLDLKITIF